MNYSNSVDFAIVGGGIVGLATAYKLQLKYPNKRIAILEKEAGIGSHQTGRNSGVIHSGIYYKPGSYKAKNCKDGRTQLAEFAAKNNIDYEICGKVIVATKEAEIPILNDIFEKGKINKTPGIKLLSSEEIKEKEPFIDGLKGIYVPSAGIIDYVAVCKKFVELIIEKNPESFLKSNCEIKAIESQKDRTLLSTITERITASKVIFCTGLQSDRIAEKDGLKLDMHIVGFRGDYYELTSSASTKIKNLVYPVPDPKYPFLGVHFTKMIHGGVECGPNAVFSFKREGYKRTSFNWRDTYEALTFKGTWKLFFKNWKKGIDEYKRAFSKILFVKALKEMMPSLTINDVQPSRAGVRAQAIDFDGNMVDDFKILKHNQNVHVLNAPSPAATACLAIADEIVKHVNN
ncbi:MAG: L-2-hydroxyglutarate oxidase [Lutibacter sp.]